MHSKNSLWIKILNVCPKQNIRIQSQSQVIVQTNQKQIGEGVWTFILYKFKIDSGKANLQSGLVSICRT